MSGTSPNSWINKDQSVVIWYDNQKNNWKIGPRNDHGTSTCWIYSDNITSNSILPLNIKNWYYLAGKNFLSTPDVTIELKGKVIINQPIKIYSLNVLLGQVSTFLKDSTAFAYGLGGL